MILYLDFLSYNSSIYKTIIDFKKVIDKYLKECYISIRSPRQRQHSTLKTEQCNKPFTNKMLVHHEPIKTREFDPGSG